METLPPSASHHPGADAVRLVGVGKAALGLRGWVFEAGGG
jgi:hypothetical protein